MKRVTEQEFKVMKKYFPHEIRFYVEVPKAENTMPKTRAKAKRARRKVATNGRGDLNKPVRTTGKPLASDENTKVYRVFQAARRHCSNNPVPRTELRTRVSREVGEPENIVCAHLSQLISRGCLAYDKGAAQ